MSKSSEVLRNLLRVHVNARGDGPHLRRRAPSARHPHRQHGTPVIPQRSPTSPTTRSLSQALCHKKHKVLSSGKKCVNSEVILRCEYDFHTCANEPPLSCGAARLYRKHALSARSPPPKPFRHGMCAISVRCFSFETEFVSFSLYEYLNVFLYCS